VALAEEEEALEEVVEVLEEVAPEVDAKHTSLIFFLRS
jgi:hypothetical protein